MTLGGAAQEKSYSNGHHHHVVPEQSLTCSLCRSHLRDARVLPACLHSFCLGCLQDYAQDRDRFSCPLCKTVRTCEQNTRSPRFFFILVRNALLRLVIRTFIRS